MKYDNKWFHKWHEVVSCTQVLVEGSRRRNACPDFRQRFPRVPTRSCLIPSAFCQQSQSSASRCSQQVNATREELNVITITLFSPRFGKTEVESRVNISRGRFNTLECVATVEGEQAYTLFSISGELPCRRRGHGLGGWGLLVKTSKVSTSRAENLSTPLNLSLSDKSR